MSNDLQPGLRLPLEEARAALDGRVAAGRKAIGPEPWFGRGLRRREHAVRSWFEYNRDWLEANIGAAIAAEHVARVASLGERASPDMGLLLISFRATQVREIVDDLIAHLISVRDRLELWAHNAPRRSPVNASGPIFVVHGRDMGRANEVARAVELPTGRQAVILSEQTDEGRTIIEKFEANAESAAFAVVVMTGDDEGRLRSSDVGPARRARQNVILELGYFIGKLGRSRVAVLVDEGLEHPSDILGLAYTPFDAAGAWKTRLRSELRAAGIELRQDVE
jgi:predicted nucleotide-binding protein